MNDDLRTFLDEFNISEEDFESTGLLWSDLQSIKKDYKTIRKELNLIARYIEDKLHALNTVHSVRCRIKDPDHLLAKIIRKKIQRPGREITIDNYKSLVTDLIGIRAIHLFKEDWVHIHKFIEDAWDLHETPIAYIREGDSGSHIDEYHKYDFKIEPHPFGYRSIHYLVEVKPSKNFYIAEIQVRTIFEEGWSEIDHTIKYPKDVNDPLLDKFLDSFNILAGNSDQMGSFVRNLKNDLLKGTKKIEMYEKLTEENIGIIDTLKKRVAGTIGELNSKLHKVERQMNMLVAAGVASKAFEGVLRNAKAAVSKFELVLAKDPQKAADLFESAAQKLERLEKLLEIILENNSYGDGAEDDMVVSYKKRASRFVHNVQVIGEFEESITRPTLAYVRDQDDVHVKIENAISAIHARNGFVTFLIGPRYKDIKFLSSEIIANRAKVKALTDATHHISDSAVKFALETQIDLFNQQNSKLQEFVTSKQKSVSLFGWLFRLSS